MIKLVNVSKFYSSNNVIAMGLRKINLELHVNEFIAVVGESGSGKTTLLNVISGIDSYEEGEMFINGEETSYYSVADLENYRKKYVAFVFQDYNLIDSYTVLQNVEAPLILSGYPKDQIKKRALEIIDRVGLKTHANHKATRLSGGQKQRVVIARALAKDCPIIAADEPTGNLDSNSARQIIELLADIAKEKLVIMVTHDFSQVEEFATRKIRIYDGEIVEDKELVKVEKQDLPKLKDKEYKATFRSALSLSLRNLLAVPKKTILMILVFSFFAIFVGLAYGGYLVVTNQNPYSYNQHFSFTNNNRIVVKKADNSTFSPEDLAELENMSNVKGVITEDYVLDNPVYMTSQSGDIDYFKIIYLPKSYLGDDYTFLYGDEPNKDGEIIIAAYGEILDLKEEAIGQKISTAYNNTNIDSNFEIAGVIDNDIIPQSDQNYQNYIFLDDDLWDEYARAYYLQRYGSLTYEINQGSFKITSDQIFVDDSLPDNQVNVRFVDSPDCTTSCDVVLSLEDYYIDKEFNVKIVIDNSVLTNRYYINQNTYDSIFPDDIYQVSVLTEDEYNVTDLLKSIQRINEGLTLKYKAVYPYDSAVSEQFEAILLIISSIGMLFLLGFTMIVSTFITYIIFKSIINTKLHDYGIFRTIGANKRIIEIFIYVENLYIVFVSFLLFVILSVVVKNTTDVTNGFLEPLSIFNFGRYLVFLILLVLMSLFISRKYSNRIFASSVSTTLKSELE
ncbi:MAG: ATP-binding cassette domain-containing protein [Candidatus Izemoplasmatales bacterium]